MFFNRIFLTILNIPPKLHCSHSQRILLIVLENLSIQITHCHKARISLGRWVGGRSDECQKLDKVSGEVHLSQNVINYF